MPKPRGASGAAGSKNKAVTTRKPKKLPPASSAASRAGPDAASDKTATTRQQRDLSFVTQQCLLDVFRRALAPTLASSRLNEVLQSIKRALFERDFAGAFGGVENASADDQTDFVVDSAIDSADTPADTPAAPPPLEAYAARWSPTRALCYASILGSPLVQDCWNGGGGERRPSTSKTPLRMVALGGGAAEIVAFGALLAVGEPADSRPGDLVLVDAAPWAPVVDTLRAAITDAVGGPDGQALVRPPDRLRVDVRQLDILTLDDGCLIDMLGHDSTPAAAAADIDTSPPPTTLITLFFTLNELFTAGGLGATAGFLLRLTNASLPGTVLLVADSPGSYAETIVGSQARRYPMRWLVDKVLLQDSGAWTKAHEEEATWFRLSTSLSYPIRLEDMRYQLHLYVRT